ncbi:MAG: twin-arginine translocase TatA/TatE family subunit [candidate division Zixibacteria bacterium]|jgi:sec-independent protein translocase protein TatA|nr:twin-arginine translocase TatA/TatE family subunit [candidate division Zixibacteria bacterium]
MFGLGTTELLLILLAILLIFGGSKLPQLARGLGKSVSEFKKGIREGEEQVKPENKDKDKKDLAG